MTAEKLREFLHTRPFRPFNLHLADGRRLRVAHPELIALSPNGRTAAVYSRKSELELVDLLLVTSLGRPAGSRPGES